MTRFPFFILALWPALLYAQPALTDSLAASASSMVRVGTSTTAYGQAPQAPSDEREALTGDWGGLRTAMAREGLTIEGAYTGDAFAVATSGGPRGALLHNLDLAATLDGDALIGWPGATGFVYVLGNASTASPSEYARDAQVVSNIDAPQALRLYEAWVEQQLWEGRASVKAGLYDLNSEFYVTETAALFLNSAQGIGPEFAGAGENGPSIFPFTSAALRLAIRPSQRAYVQVAALDAVPGDPARPRATVVRLSSEEGFLMTAEAGYRLGARDGVGLRIAVGGWRYSRLVAPLVPGAPAERDAGTYAIAEGILFRESDAPEQGLAAFGRLGFANERVHQSPISWGGGLVYTGLLPNRAEDQVGLAVATLRTGDVDQQTTRGAAMRYRSGEVALEASYRLALTPWIAIQPDVQYVLNPGADPAAADALVTGLRLEVSF